MISMKEALSISRRSHLEKQIRQAAENGESKTTVIMDNEEAASLAMEVCFVEQFKVSDIDKVVENGEVKYHFNVSWEDYKPQLHPY